MLNDALGPADADGDISDQVVVVLVDGDGTTRSVASSVEVVLGLDAAPLVGVPVTTMVDPHDHDRLLQACSAARSEAPQPTRLALRFIDRTGRPTWLDAEVRSAPAGAPGDLLVTARPYAIKRGGERRGDDLAGADPYHALVQNSADILMLVDPDGTVRFANPTMLRTLGLSPDQLLGTQVLEILHPDDHPAVTQAMIDVLEFPDLPRTIEMRARHGDGTYRWIEGSMRNLLDHPDVGGILGNGRDVTERRRAEAALRVSEARFRSLAASAPNAIFEIDEHGTLRYANERWTEITGVGPDEAREAWRVVNRDDLPALREAWYEVGNVSGLEMQLRVERSDGEQRWVQVRTKPVLDDDGVVTGHVGTMHDVTDLVHYQDELSYSALHDPLTGLANRRVLVDRLDAALGAARRSGSSIALLFIDVDHFKFVNDRLGHQMGDDLLVTIAQRLLHAVRPGDLVTRFGGDEFVVLCQQITDRDEIVALAERLQHSAGGVVGIGSTQVQVSVSVGVVVAFGEVGADDVLRDADAAMYAAKASGRDRTEVFDATVRGRVADHLLLEGELRQALDNEEFVLRYQPVVSLRDGEVIGVEALLRWDHPTLGLREPESFLAVAESTGLLTEIGAWVLRSACREACDWPHTDQGGAPVVFVNLSGGQLAHPGLVDEVAAVLGDTGLDPSRLCLEVDESALVGASSSAVHLMSALRSLGVQLAVDDFAAGLSSLAQLARIPFDVVKIDSRFTSSLGRDDADAAVVAAAVGLAHSLGRSAVAVGVESAAQLDQLRSLGCDAVQGFHVSHPLSAGEFAAFLAGG